jgi:hypothetical protein
MAAPDKYQTADNGWLGISAGCEGKSERPFQLQPRHLILGQSGHRRWLKPAVVEIRAPAVPSWPVDRLRKPGLIVRALL